MYRIYFDNFDYEYHFEISFAFLFYFDRKHQHKVKFYFHPNFINKVRKEILSRFPFFEERIRIKIPDRYDLRLILTVYQRKDMKSIETLKNRKDTLMIAHEYHPDFNEFQNIIYLTPIIYHLNPKPKNKFLFPSEFPYPETKPNFQKPPIFLIQGNIQSKRRNYRSLIPVLEHYSITNSQPNTSVKPTIQFKIMILGRGNLPEYLQPYQNQIILKPNLNDHEYHQAIQEATFILPLVDHTYQHKYFKKKLTSSMTYGIGFGLRFVIFDKLAQAYQINNQYLYYSTITTNPNQTPNTNQNTTNPNQDRMNNVNLLPAFQEALKDFQQRTLKPRPQLPKFNNLK